MKRSLVILLATAATLSAENVFVEYDLSSICEERFCRRAPELGFDSEDGGIGVGTTNDWRVAPSEVGTLIRMCIAPGTWDTPPRVAESTGMRLMVRHTPDVQKKVAALLKHLEGRAERSIVLDAELVAVAPSSPVRPGPLPAAELRALDAVLADPSKGARLASLRVSLRPGQRGHQASITRRRLSTDRDSVPFPDAVVTTETTYREGATLDVLPLLTSDGKVVATVRLSQRKLDRLETLDLPIASGGPAALPVESVFDVRQTLLLVPGETVVSACAPAGAGRPGWTLATLVTARVDSDSSKVEDIRAWDTGALLADLTVFGPPRIGPPSMEEVGPSASDPMPETNETLTREALLEILRTDAGISDEDPEGPRVTLMGDSLVAFGPAETLDAIGRVLARLEADAFGSSIMEARTLVFPVAEWAAGRDVVQRAGGITEALSAELDAAVAAGRLRAEGMAGMAALARTRGWVHAGSRRRILSGWSTSIDSGAAVGEPAFEEASGGLLIDARVAASFPGAADLKLRGQWVALEEPRTLDKASSFGPIQTIGGTRVQFDSDGSVSAGREILAGTSISGGDVRVFLVRAAVRP